MRIFKVQAGILAILAASQLPAAAFADCVHLYQHDIRRIKDKHHWLTSDAGWMSSAIVAVVPIGVTGILTTLDSIKISDHEKVLRVFTGAKSGTGLQIARVAEELETTVERVAEVVNELNAKNAFCQDAYLLSYGEVVELVRLTMKN